MKFFVRTLLAILSETSQYFFSETPLNIYQKFRRFIFHNNPKTYHPESAQVLPTYEKNYKMQGHHSA